MSHLWTVLDLDDGFHQMPLTEERRPVTAFCTAWGVHQWGILPMGVKVGPQVYQRMVTHCIRHLPPSVRAYIDDLPVGNPPSKASRGKGKLLDSCALDERAITEHYELVRKPFRCLADHHLQVKEEKCHLFCQRVGYFGHTLHEGQRSAAPEKVAAVRDWTEATIHTPQQMKGFLGVCNLYSIFIARYASLAAPLMDSLKGKYERAPEGGKCKVPKDRNLIEWTEIMRQTFAKFKEALCDRCALYFPNHAGEYGIHTDASDFGIGGVLEQQLPDGSWASCALHSKKLESQIWYGPEGEALGFIDQRAWSVREEETYALVSCLLKFKSWVSERKVTVFRDHKSFESWFQEDLCTMAGPLGRRGRWHEFLSRYNIVVVYKPGKKNDVADGMSRWAYPAGLVDDTNFHGSDADFKGYEDWEAQAKGRSGALIDWLSVSGEGSESVPPCSHTAKCHGHCSGYSNPHAASHYPCFHWECASLETVALDKPNAQRRADALLHLKYQAQVTSDPLPADRPLAADPPRCPDCLDHHKINTCGILNPLHSDPDDADCGSEAEESVGPEFFKDPDLHGITHVMSEYPHTPHALIASVTWVNVCPVCSILYCDLEPYYAEDPNLKVLLDWGIKKNIEYGIYRWHEPQWGHPHIRVDSRAVVPVAILSKVIQTVHYVAHPDAPQTLEPFKG